ncbi:uncharacterized protein LOC123318076 isoform X1 [Coccinella septempunctata]|uniref:uncharacterized protein LOC123318076 isoform X1 n=1 Tax=Coccinella septempunctata TaxID=41139 RepID=UPI001D05FEB3|nr:uncharacterized protein LOC123318076 isoform X1 [Coccinella septempunctata]
MENSSHGIMSLRVVCRRQDGTRGHDVLYRFRRLQASTASISWYVSCRYVFYVGSRWDHLILDGNESAFRFWVQATRIPPMERLAMPLPNELCLCYTTNWSLLAAQI